MTERERSKEKEKPEKIYLDTFVFMDILSGKPGIAEKAAEYVEQIKKSSGVVSAVLLTELGFHLRRRGSREKTDEVLSYIQSLPNLQIIPVSDRIAVAAGRLRAKYFKRIEKLTYFDCIHIATAVESQCGRFVTGDRHFKDVEEIEMEIY